MEMDNIVNSIEATDDYTAVFRLKKVNAPFIANMAMDFADIISPTAFMKDPAAYVRNPVGTGPFKFQRWVKDDRIILEANKEYWDKSKGPHLDRLIFRVIPENSVRFLELKTGNIHMCEFPNPADIPMAKKDPKLQIFSQPGMNIGYLGFNLKKDLWGKNQKLREAIAHAINRKAIVDKIYQGMGEVAKNCIPPTMWGYNKDIPGYSYDVELAKKLLTEAGYPEGSTSPEITLWSMPVARPGTLRALRWSADRRPKRRIRPGSVRLGDLPKTAERATCGYGPVPAGVDRRQWGPG
jgi:peptide/nickel transport system substrate-binding protein